MDSTFFKTFFNERDLAAAAVFDGHSRTPLAITSFEGKPDGNLMSNLLEPAVRAFGKPKYIITDRGPEFISDVFRNACTALGIKPRFAFKDNIHATARLERFWRTLKDIAKLRAPNRPADLREFEQRLAVFLTHYVFFRPHRGRGMDGATPAEVFARREPVVKSAKSPRADAQAKDQRTSDSRSVTFRRRRGTIPFLVPAHAAEHKPHSFSHIEAHRPSRETSVCLRPLMRGISAAAQGNRPDRRTTPQSPPDKVWTPGRIHVQNPVANSHCRPNRAILKAARLMGTADATHLAASRGRDASVENLDANARLERFWKTLKGIGLLKVIPPLTFKDFETRTAIALYYYIHFRPQRAASPWGAPASAAPQPRPSTASNRVSRRGLEGEVVQPSPVDIEFVGVSAELPFLRRTN